MGWLQAEGTALKVGFPISLSVLWDDCGKLKKANLGHLFDRMVVYCLTA